MEHPYYTVTVANLTRGWSYTVVEGEKADPDQPVHLTSPLTYTWGFANDLIPAAHMDPFEATVNLAAHTADDLPETYVGDLFSIDVRVGTDGPRVIAPPPMRAGEPTVDLVGGLYAARQAIPLVDLSIDWRDTEPGYTYGMAVKIANPGSLFGPTIAPRGLWRERIAEIANRIGISIGCPTWWADNEAPVISGLGSPLSAWEVLSTYPRVYKGKTIDLLAELINSHQPNGITHTWVTAHSPAGHPTGYRRVGPNTWDVDDPDPIPEPDTFIRIEAVPATRRAPGAAGHAMELAVVDGVLTLVPREPYTGAVLTRLGLDADWCVIPAKARRARDTAIGVVQVVGERGVMNEAGTAPLTQIGAVDVFSNGVPGTSVRELPTQLRLDSPEVRASFPPGDVATYPAAATAAALFLSDQSSVEAWGYDAFTLKGHLIPQDIAEWMLPKIAPRVPGEVDGDGRLVRQVTIYDLHPSMRFQAQPITGFITGGTLTISGGQLTWSLTTAPGQPHWTDAPPAPMTVGEFTDTATGVSYDHVDPHLTWADLDHAEAS